MSVVFSISFMPLELKFCSVLNGPYVSDHAVSHYQSTTEADTLLVSDMGKVSLALD